MMCGRYGSHDSAEYLMGHAPGLQRNYLVLKESGQLETDYRKALPYLELRHTDEAREALETGKQQAISISVLQSANNRIQKELEELKNKSAMQSELVKMIVSVIPESKLQELRTKPR